MSGKPLKLDEEQVLYFRARRGHLAGPGAADAATAARAMLGAQSQQLPPSLLALSQRMKARPTAAALQQELFGEGRSLVRAWGQRETLHVYEAAGDWPAIIAARGDWAVGGRKGVVPTPALIQKAHRLLEKAGEPLTRNSMAPITPASLIAEAAEKMGPGEPARRLAMGRLLWHLCLRGDACVADKIGAEQSYAARSLWFPDHAWPRHDAVDAATELTRRYLATYGPATATDVAHFFGARVARSTKWLERLAPELVEVECGGRKGLVALAEDGAELRKKAPGGDKAWPVRLLPLWESMLMGHADKTWTTADEADRKQVWRKAAFVAAVVLARGRVVATWTQAVKRRRLVVTVAPLSGWRKTRHLAGVKKEAVGVGRFLGVEGAEVVVEGG